MTDKKKEEGKVNEGQDPVVETQAEKENNENKVNEGAAEKALETKEKSKKEIAAEKAAKELTDAQTGIAEMVAKGQLQEAWDAANALPFFEGKKAYLASLDTMIQGKAKENADQEALKAEALDRLEKGHFKKAVEAAQKVENNEPLLKVIMDAWNKAKEDGTANPAKSKGKAKQITLETVEKDLVVLANDVDMLIKVRAKAGRPQKQLFILKKRLDSLILQYSKFKGSSIN